MSELLAGNNTAHPPQSPHCSTCCVPHEERLTAISVSQSTAPGDAHRMAEDQLHAMLRRRCSSAGALSEHRPSENRHSLHYV
jgi:hypothetical protein